MNQYEQHNQDKLIHNFVNIGIQWPAEIIENMINGETK